MTHNTESREFGIRTLTKNELDAVNGGQVCDGQAAMAAQQAQMHTTIDFILASYGYNVDMVHHYEH